MRDLAPFGYPGTHAGLVKVAEAHGYSLHFDQSISLYRFHIHFDLPLLLINLISTMRSGYYTESISLSLSARSNRSSTQKAKDPKTTRSTLRSPQRSERTTVFDLDDHTRGLVSHMLRSLVSKPSTSATPSAVTQYIEPEEQSDPLVPTPPVIAENKFTVMMNGFSSVSINPFQLYGPQVHAR